MKKKYKWKPISTSVKLEKYIFAADRLLFTVSFIWQFLFLWLAFRPAELPLSDLPANVELHALEAAQRLREEHGGRHRPRPQLQLCLPAGEHHERVLPPEELQPDSDWRIAGHQGLRHRHATGWVGQRGHGCRDESRKWERPVDFCSHDRIKWCYWRSREKEEGAERGE